MADPRFFSVAGPFTVAELAQRTGARIAGAAQADRVLRDVAPLETAGPDELSFLANPKYRPALGRTGAGAAFVHPDNEGAAAPGLTLLITPNPYRAYALAAQAFYPDPPPVPGIGAGAVIDPTARLGEGCRIDPNAVIGAGAELGRACHIGANAVIGAGCILGDAVRVGANASLSHCLVGARVLVYPGVRIGQDGFGFAPDPNGHVKLPQLGRVIIGDDVEIGANSTIDRGAGPDTVIGAGTMIDNLVQIGHNVQVGRGCVLVAQSGISGSTRLGDFVMVGGQSGITGHLTIGSGARVAGQSGVTHDMAPGDTVMGSPAVPIREHHRQVLLLRRLAAKKGE
jgi:UDP-3-O-[3-hydroxymyristoyl] glucosamine N-acyltransferase